MADLRAEIARLKQEGEKPRVILQAPCSFGKAVVSCALMDMSLKMGRKSVFLASGRVLIFQKSRKLSECGIPHSVVMPGAGKFLDDDTAFEHRGYSHGNDVIVCSKDTYMSRLKSGRIQELSADLVLVDEAHVALSSTFIDALNMPGLEDATVVGFTATPARGNGRGLGDFYKSIVVGATYDELLTKNDPLTGRPYLVPAKCFAPYEVDMDGVDVGSNGEYVVGQASARHDRDELVGDVVQQWFKFAENRPTVVFASSVEHSIHLRREFEINGVPAAHIDANTPQSEREEYFNAVDSGDIKVLTNFFVLGVGFDLPIISCCQYARSMKSLNVFLQTAGRVLRAHPSKTDHALFIDHGGNIRRHGWPTEDHEWTLDPDQEVQVADSKNKPPQEREPIVCPNCGAMRTSGKECLNCGHRHVRTGARVRTADGTFKEISRPKRKKKSNQSEQQKYWLSCLARIANTNGTFSQAGWIFKQRYGVWPNEAGVGPLYAQHERNVRVSSKYPKFVRRRNR